MNRPAYNKHKRWRLLLQATILILTILLLLAGVVILYRLGRSAGRLATAAGRLAEQSASLLTQPGSRHFLMQGALSSLLAFVPGILLAIYFSAYAGQTIRRNTQAILRYLSKLPLLVLGLPLLLPEWAAMERSLSGSSPAAVSLGAILLFPLLSHHAIRIIGALPSGLGEVSAALGVSRRYSITHMLIPMAAPAMTLAALLAGVRAIGEYSLITLLFRLPSGTVSASSALQTISVLSASLLWAALLNGLTDFLLKAVHRAGK